MSIYRFRVAWFDCDPAGIVFYPRFLAYMNEAAHGFLEARGFPLSTLNGRGIIGVPVVSLKADFRAPLVCGDHGEIDTAVVAIGRSSITFRHIITKGGTEAVTCDEVRVHAEAHAAGIRGAAIPDDLRAALLAPG